ncbi:type VI secretion protein, partial [Vibrio owensii]
EPHSPVPFLLERAIRWGYLSLPELLQEMTGGNSQVLSHINQLTGMDNLEQTILKTIPEPQSVPDPVPAVSAPEVQNTSNEESQSATSIEPTTSEQSDTPNTTNQPEVKTTQSSSGITDFEW